MTKIISKKTTRKKSHQSQNGNTVITKKKNIKRNEKDLHHQVVRFWRQNYPRALLIPGNGEVKFKILGIPPHLQHLINISMLENTVRKQIIKSNFLNGYETGTPDLIVNKKTEIKLPNGSTKNFTMIAFEFKRENGNGVLSSEQEKVLERLREEGAYTLVCNDYDDIVRISNCYVAGEPWKELLGHLPHKSLIRSITQVQSIEEVIELF